MSKLALRLDWDGELRGSKITRILFLARLNIISLFANHVTIETSCGYKKARALLLLKRKLSIIPAGFSKEILYHPKKTASREKCILSVARVARYKGVDDLIRAVEIVFKKKTAWRLLIAGMFEDIGYLHELREQINRARLNDRILFLGEVSQEQLASLYVTSAIFCTMPRMESYGLSRAEALVNGMYVVTTEAGCARDLIGARVVKIGEFEKAASSLLELIDLIENNKGNVVPDTSSILSWDDVAQRFISI